jgi:excisionase family DNA binding protein
MPEEPDMTITEVAELLRVNRETVRRWAQAGRFPHAYILPGSGGLRVSRADVEALKEQYRIKPATDAHGAAIAEFRAKAHYHRNAVDELGAKTALETAEAYEHLATIAQELSPDLPIQRAFDELSSTERWLIRAAEERTTET